MNFSSKDLGVMAENLAHNFLLKKGLRILERNWRFHRYEVDIIAQRGDDIVFVEVKSRSTDVFGAPENSVDFKKRQKIIRSADVYIQKNNLHSEVRFDIISIVFKNHNYKLKHIEEAFQAHEVR